MGQADVTSQDFAAARAVMRRDGGALSMATFFLPHAKRDGACAVYAFFKMIRDALTATGSRAARGARVARPADCSEIELRIRERIEGIYGGALELPNAEFRDETQHVLAAMTETVRRHEILRADLLEFVDASAADANVTRYATWDALRKHCRGIGGMASAAACAVLGSTHSDARDRAIRVGEALRLTQILCMLKSDAAAGRLYLPLEDLARFRYGERELFNGIVSDRFRDVMKFQIARAQRLLDEGAAAISWIAGDGSRLAAATIVESCRGTLEKLEAAGAAVFEHPPRFLATRIAIQRLASAWRLARRDPQVVPLAAEAG